SAGPLIRSLAAALVCCCLLAGCSPGLTRPSVDLLPALSSPLGAPEAPLPARAHGESEIEPGDAPSVPAAPADGSILPVAAPPASSPPERVGLTSPSDSPPPLSLPDAIAVGLQNNPRLRAALAAIERARGQEEVAFAPFLPQIDLLNRYVATGKTTLPGSPGPTGVVNVTGIGHYQVYQSELQLQWTLYDFGRTAGRYRQADVREKIAQFQTVRARETVAYDVATAYLQALEAAALRRIAVETVRRAEAVLEDVRARKEGGVALRDDVLRGQVQLSEARDS